MTVINSDYQSTTMQKVPTLCVNLRHLFVWNTDLFWSMVLLFNCQPPFINHTIVIEFWKLLYWRPYPIYGIIYSFRQLKRNINCSYMKLSWRFTDAIRNRMIKNNVFNENLVHAFNWILIFTIVMNLLIKSSQSKNQVSAGSGLNSI